MSNEVSSIFLYNIESHRHQNNRRINLREERFNFLQPRYADIVYYFTGLKIQGLK